MNDHAKVGNDLNNMDNSNEIHIQGPNKDPHNNYHNFESGFRDESGRITDLSIAER